MNESKGPEEMGLRGVLGRLLGGVLDARKVTSVTNIGSLIFHFLTRSARGGYGVRAGVGDETKTKAVRPRSRSGVPGAGAFLPFPFHSTHRPRQHDITCVSFVPMNGELSVTNDEDCLL